MLLLLCRHAAAAERDETLYPDDTLRPLIPRGRKSQARISRRLARRGRVPEVVFSSPWKRAWQTAGILARESGAGQKRRVALPALAGEPDVAAVGQAVGQRGADAVVALVGHEPWISELASLLLTGSATRLAVPFPKSAVMGIRADAVAPAAGSLEFFFDR
jgi:phosphohistidine phosphatase